MTDETTGIHAIDSLSANEFHVEINGEVATGIFGVSGIYTRHVDLTAGKLIHQPVTITKMVQRNPKLPFNEWVSETLAHPTSKITREIAIVAMDDGVETRRWVYREAWISAVSFSDFDSGSEELVEERLVVQHSGVEERWPEA